MSALPCIPPIKLPDGTVLVGRQSAEVVRAALVADMVNDLREAISNGWYVHGHATRCEYAAELVDAFAVGIPRLDVLRHVAITFQVIGMTPGATKHFQRFVDGAIEHAAESLVDMAEDGRHITFGPLQ